ncbi:unnamed protein product [Polarella glacialis]|uniref:Uncharacterized protein n=1 Tax=Polarella glacialis TaxID=89957 RepID=A0A813F1N0_POLGL|nr:unnamed protein product [Polarella glacialis]
MLRGAFSLVCLGLACGLSDDIASSELLCDAPPEGLSLLQSKARVVVRPASDGAAEEEAAMAAMISFARQSRNSSAGQGIPRAPISVNFPAATGVGVLEEQRQWLFNPRLEASSCWSTAPPAAFLGSVLASVATGVLPPSAVADASAPNSVNLVGLTAVGATLAAAASTSRRGQKVVEKVVEKSGRAAVVARRAETIAATAIANGNFTILVKALQKAGLVDGQKVTTAQSGQLAVQIAVKKVKDGQKVTTAQSGQLAVQIAGEKVKDEWCRSSDVAVTGDGHHCRASTKDFIDVSETQHVESSECDFAAGERCVTSFLTIGSPSGLLFGITNIVGNFGTVFVDQSYWQSAVAANPKSAVKGFLIGGLVWFAVPFCMTTTTGLASRALTMHPELGPAYISAAASGSRQLNDLLPKQVLDDIDRIPGEANQMVHDSQDRL